MRRCQENVVVWSVGARWLDTWPESDVRWVDCQLSNLLKLLCVPLRVPIEVLSYDSSGHLIIFAVWLWGWLGTTLVGVTDLTRRCFLVRSPFAIAIYKQGEGRTNIRDRSIGGGMGRTFCFANLLLMIGEPYEIRCLSSISTCLEYCSLCERGVLAIITSFNLVQSNYA